MTASGSVLPTRWRKPFVAALGVGVLLVATFAMLGLGGDSDEGAPERRAVSQRFRCERCNVVLISIDTLRADHLATYGYERRTSPEIDRFAGEALVFDRAFATSPVTLGSHMSIFTGLYPSHHGVVRATMSLPDSTITLADLLHREGYTTAAFTGGGFVRQKFNYHTFDHFQHKSYWDIHDAEIRQLEEVLAWIENRDGDPFFLFWHTYKVHSPYSPEDEYDVFASADYQGIVDPDPEEEAPVCIGSDKARQCNWKGKPYYDLLVDRMTAGDIQHVIDKYDGEILAVDAMFSRLMAKLDAEGLTDDTVVIFLSDHGETFAERKSSYFIGHGVLYQEVLRVPLMIKIPSGPKGRIPHIVELIDVMPTVLEIVGLKVPEGIDGSSLFEKAREPRGRHPARAELVFRGMESVRVPGFSLISRETRRGVRTELYDLRQDPGETRNLVAENHPMEQALARLLISRSGDVPQAGEEIVLDDDLIRDLKSLGYL